MRWRTSVLVAAAVTLAPAACGKDATSPTVADVAGHYVATRLTATLTTVGSSTADLLAHGSSADITLAADGTTSGVLVLRDVEDFGLYYDQRLDGTWSLHGDRVTVLIPYGLVTEAPLTYRGGRLSGSTTSQGVRVSVVLEKR